MVIAFQSWPSRGNTIYWRGHYILHQDTAKRDRTNKQHRVAEHQVVQTSPCNLHFWHFCFIFGRFHVWFCNQRPQKVTDMTFLEFHSHHCLQSKKYFHTHGGTNRLLRRVGRTNCVMSQKENNLHKRYISWRQRVNTIRLKELAV
jgi:hypothetical protein